MGHLMIYISPLLVLLAVICVVMQRNHLLMALLALEITILAQVMFLSYLMNTSSMSLIIVLLTFGACEASLGLACMVAMSRSFGNDRLHSLVINKC